MTKQTQPTPHPDVVATPLPDKQVVLLHLGTQQYFSLNPTGARIWELVAAGMATGDIAERLAQEFDISPERAADSVRTLLADLTRAQLLLDGPPNA